MTERFVKLHVFYYDDIVLASLDDAHEVMFTRALAYCGRAKTGGFVLRAKVLELSRKTSLAQAVKVADRLCRPVGDSDGPFEKVDGGYRIRNWSVYQDQLDDLDRRRKNDRDRKRRQRQSDRTSHGLSRDVSRDRSRDVTPTEEEKEKDAAAAAGRGGGRRLSIDDLPGELVVLRSKFAAWTSLAQVSFAHLTREQADTLVTLIRRHGDDALVENARRNVRTAGTVQAFIDDWTALGAPRLVRDEPRCAICNQPKTACERAALTVDADDRHAFEESA